MAFNLCSSHIFLNTNSLKQAESNLIKSPESMVINQRFTYNIVSKEMATGYADAFRQALVGAGIEADVTREERNGLVVSAYPKSAISDNDSFKWPTLKFSVQDKDSKIQEMIFHGVQSISPEYGDVNYLSFAFKQSEECPRRWIWGFAVLQTVRTTEPYSYPRFVFIKSCKRAVVQSFDAN